MGEELITKKDAFLAFGNKAGTDHTHIEDNIIDLAHTPTEAVCKAWVNLDGTGTIVIKDSFNVSGITDVDVGEYTITWDTDFANTNYVISITVYHDGANLSERIGGRDGTKAVGSTGIRVQSSGGSDYDFDDISVLSFGAQA